MKLQLFTQLIIANDVSIGDRESLEIKEIAQRSQLIKEIFGKG